MELEKSLKVISDELNPEIEAVEKEIAELENKRGYLETLKLAKERREESVVRYFEALKIVENKPEDIK